MTCRLPFARKKSQASRRARRKTRRLTPQTSSRAVNTPDDDEHRGVSSTTVFPEFAIPADSPPHAASRSDFVIGRRSRNEVVGSRTVFSQEFLKDLAAVWATRGKQTMISTAQTNPAVFFATCARLIPNDVRQLGIPPGVRRNRR